MVRKRQLDSPAQVAHLGVGLDHIAKFPVAIRTDHLPAVADGRRARDLKRRMFRIRPDEETDLGHTGRAERLDRGDMQRRGLRAAINLRFIAGWPSLLSAIHSSQPNWNLVRSVMA